MTALRDTGQFSITLDGEQLTFSTDDVLVTEVPRGGWIVESQRGVTIALDTRITPQLEAEGTARDVVRVVQQARREAGLEVADRIALTVAAAPAVQDAVRAHEGVVTHETLATTLTLVAALPDGFAGIVGDGAAITVRVVAT